MFEGVSCLAGSREFVEAVRAGEVVSGRRGGEAERVRVAVESDDESCAGLEREAVVRVMGEDCKASTCMCVRARSGQRAGHGAGWRDAGTRDLRLWTVRSACG